MNTKWSKLCNILFVYYNICNFSKWSQIFRRFQPSLVSWRHHDTRFVNLVLVILPIWVDSCEKHTKISAIYIRDFEKETWANTIEHIWPQPSPNKSWMDWLLLSSLQIIDYIILYMVCILTRRLSQSYSSDKFVYMSKISHLFVLHPHCVCLIEFSLLFPNFVYSNCCNSTPRYSLFILSL